MFSDGVHGVLTIVRVGVGQQDEDEPLVFRGHGVTSIQIQDGVVVERSETTIHPHLCNSDFFLKGQTQDFSFLMDGHGIRT